MSVIESVTFQLATLRTRTKHRATLRGGAAAADAMMRCRDAVVALSLFAIAVAMSTLALAQERANFFNDPFVQIANGIADCPIPEGPLITRDEMRSQGHLRAEHGTRCYMSGRCRLPNSYQYDPEIIARVKKAIEADGRFAGTSVWAEGQRRWVTLKGCVRTKPESEALEQLVRSIDDVVNVVNQLVIKSERRDKR